MNNFDYIPIDQKIVDSYVKEFEESRKAVLAKIRFDNGFDDSVIALDFMDELLVFNKNYKVNIKHVVFNVAYEYLSGVIENMADDGYSEILGVVSRWSNAFKCAYDHSSSVNFSWAFRELLKEVNPLVERWSIDEDDE